jgi:plasmid stability protein
MKNITVSVPDDIYRKARIKAAERETSVSAEVRRFLTEFAEEESEFDRLEREMIEVINRPREFGVRKRIPRNKLYER